MEGGGFRVEGKDALEATASRALARCASEIASCRWGVVSFFTTLVRPGCFFATGLVEIRLCSNLKAEFGNARLASRSLALVLSLMLFYHPGCG